MSGIWPFFIFPGITFWCLEYGQFRLAIFCKLMINVPNMASFYCPYSRHQLLMSEIKRGILSLFKTSLSIFRTSFSMFQTSLSIFWTSLSLFRTSILWEKWCPEYCQRKFTIFQTSMSVCWISQSMFQKSLSLGVSISLKIGCLADGKWKLSISRTSNFEVQHMDSWKCPWHRLLMSGIRTQKIGIKSRSPPWPYFGHCAMSGIWTMSGIWPVLTVHIPDIRFWCPEYGQ